jgi:hypothetical protein
MNESSYNGGGEKHVKEESITKNKRVTISEQIGICNIDEPLMHPTDVRSDENVINYKKTISKYILDPLSVIIKLAILSKKQLGCKICIHNNVLYIQEPGIFQPFVRYVYKNNKYDLHYLYNPIELACSYYLDKKTQGFTNTNIRSLFVNAQKGLEILMENYKESIVVVHTLFMYYNIISNYLGENYNKNLFIKDDISIEYTEAIIYNFHNRHLS